MKEWGLDGIICTDGGALGLLVTAHKYFPALDDAAAASIKAGITVFLDRYPDAVRAALTRGLIAEKDIDDALVRNFRVSLRLGLLDAAPKNRYASIGSSGDDPWTTEPHKAAVRRVTQKSIVLLKNDARALPLDASALALDRGHRTARRPRPPRLVQRNARATRSRRSRASAGASAAA